MKEKIILAIKGFMMGIANLIPGVSGGTLALTLGIYEDLIGAISHFFKNIKKNLRFLIPLVIGLGISIVLGSKVITESLENYPFATTFFFIGLILGGLPLLCKKVKGTKKSASHLFLFLGTFIFILLLGFLQGTGEVSLKEIGLVGYLLLFGVGAIAAATMVIPGVSGSMVLMLLGYYNPVMDAIKEFTHFENIVPNFLILVPFGIGVLVGIIGIAKLIEFLFQKYETKTYYGVLGFVLASIIAIIKPLLAVELHFLEVIIAFVLFMIGFICAYKISEK